MYRYIIQILVLFLSIVLRDCIGEILWRSTGIESLNQTSLCTLCGTKPTAFVETHCQYKRRHVFNRCCLDSSNKTIGVDLSSCSITNIHVPLLNNVKDIFWINLANNSNLNCSIPSFSNFFEGFKVLNEIILPSKCDCPGGSLLWNETRTVKDSRICSTQLGTCSIYNVSCPANSNCNNNGPGFYECLCTGKWIGYRCLVENGMPLLIVLCSIAGGTILIIVPIALLINRRKRMHYGYICVDGTSRT